MAYIFSTGAVLRMLSARPNDPLVAWIEQDRVRPFLVATSMAGALYVIRTTDKVTPEQRLAFEKRYRAVARDLRTDRREQVTGAILDIAGAQILSDILTVDAGREVLSDMDLIPAAIAMQHNLDLVISDDIEAWQALSAAIPPAIGSLALKSFPTGMA